MSDLQKYLDANLDTLVIPDDKNADMETKLGQTIKIKRKALNMSQLELSIKSGIQQASISKIEKGHANITINQLKKIANALELKIDIRLE